jgi:CDP-diacylglycerol---glycerol-3-phosphate 3-phosphatidyltransferase
MPAAQQPPSGPGPERPGARARAAAQTAREAARRPEPDPAVVASTGAPLANPANALTVARLLLVPVFLAALLHDGGGSSGWRTAAFAVFVLASLTDRIDGAMARAWNLVTDFGKIADPLADKALTGGALLALSWLGELPWVVTMLILAREVGVTALRFWVIRHGVIPASRGGKVKTVLQGIAVGCYVLPLSGGFGTGRAVLMTAAVVLTVVTGADYVMRALTLRRTSARAAMKRRVKQRAAAEGAKVVRP